MQIPFSTLSRMHAAISDELKSAYERVVSKGDFILGAEVENFEREFADYCDATYAVGVGSGLAALHAGLVALGVGADDEVIVPSNTYIATALAVSKTGARVVLAEPSITTYNLTLDSVKNATTANTKAIIPVHLYGQPADIAEIVSFAKERDIYVVEDCAQSHGAIYEGRKVGTFGDIGCFSFYPGKNLGALGDAGCIITNDDGIAENVRKFVNYGSKKKYYHEIKGENDRLDEIQAAFLRAKLPFLDEQIQERQEIASRYISGIQNDKLILPHIAHKRNHVWHIFAVCCAERDELQQFLHERGIGTNCHYPVAICDQEAYREDGLGKTPIAQGLARTELSIPLFIGMTHEEVDYVIDVLNDF